MAEKEEYSPMMQKYLETKEKYKDCILFYRLGDFYEMFFEDAITASRELEITLTGKVCGTEERAPMAGVPHHAAETYAARLIEKGYKVAICEQLSDPKTTKGIVERGVVRILTPGTIVESNLLEEKTYTLGSELPLDIVVEIDRMEEETVDYRVVFSNSEEDMYDIEAMVVHNYYNEDLFPTIGLFDEKQELLKDSEDTIELKDTIKTKKNLSAIDLELKIYIKYKDKDGEKKEIYYKTT